MVNARFVDLYAGGQNLIGRNLSIAQGGSAWRIVGTVENIIEDGPSASAAAYVYVCMPAGSLPDPEYGVSADAEPRIIMSSVRQLVRATDSATTLFGGRRLDEVMGPAVESPR